MFSDCSQAVNSWHRHQVDNVAPRDVMHRLLFVEDDEHSWVGQKLLRVPDRDQIAAVRRDDEGDELPLAEDAFKSLIHSSPFDQSADGGEAAGLRTGSLQILRNSSPSSVICDLQAGKH
jgi:hypothetical protein